MSIPAHFCAIVCCEPLGCAPTNIPFQTKHITVEWLNQVLRDSKHMGQPAVLNADESIIDIKVETFAIGEGLLSLMHRITPTYNSANAEKLPKSLVLKLTPTNLLYRITGSLLSLFKAEHLFYHRNLGPECGMNTITCYHSDLGEYGRTCILMEDFAPAKPVEQFKVGFNLEQGKMALTELAKMHAKYRGKVTTDGKTKDWILRRSDKDYFDLVGKEYAKKMVGLEGAYASYEFDSPDDYKLSHECAMWLKFNYAESAPILMNDFRRLRKGGYPNTLTHGDYRAANMVFPSENSDRFLVYDFQLLKEGNGMQDVSYCIVSSTTRENRLKYEREYLETYYNAMKELKVDDLTWKEVLHCYLRELSVMVIITYFGVVENSFKDKKGVSEEGRNLIKAYLLRINDVCKEWKWVEFMNTEHPEKLKSLEYDMPSEKLKEFIPSRYHNLLDAESSNGNSKDNLLIKEDVDL